jgi:REP element-mobilizing transposase RayT
MNGFLREARVTPHRLYQKTRSGGVARASPLCGERASLTMIKRFFYILLMKPRFPNRPPRLKAIFKQYDPPLYFITFCTQQRKQILATDYFHGHFRDFMKRKSIEGIACGEYVIMPDHIHLFLRIDPHRYQLGRTIGFIKKSLSKPLREAEIPLPHWQPGFFDHLLRNSDSYSEKWDYVGQNPVRAGYVDCADDWKYQGMIVPIRY